MILKEIKTGLEGKYISTVYVCNNSDKCYWEDNVNGKCKYINHSYGDNICVNRKAIDYYNKKIMKNNLSYEFELDCDCGCGEKLTFSGNVDGIGGEYAVQILAYTTYHISLWQRIKLLFSGKFEACVDIITSEKKLCDLLSRINFTNACGDNK
jgi:hypothetical protein